MRFFYHTALIFPSARDMKHYVNFLGFSNAILLQV